MGDEQPAEASVTAVIVTHNSAEVLPACLDSLERSFRRSLSRQAGCRVIVVDNASSDATLDIVRRHPAVHIISVPDNIGFSAANNRALALVETPLVLFLNPDTSFDQPEEGKTGALPHLLSFLAQHPQAAAVGAQLAGADGSVQPFAFGDDPSLAYMVRRAVYRLLLRRSLHDWATAIPRRVDWVAGTCLLARTSAVSAVGGWDEAFFMYFEDSDLCRRLRQQAWEVWYDPAARVVHLGGQTDYSDVRRRQMYYQSLLYYQRKHAGRLAAFIVGALLRPYMRLTGMNPQ